VSDVDIGVVDSLKVLDPHGRLEKRLNFGTAVADRAMAMAAHYQPELTDRDTGEKRTNPNYNEEARDRLR
jgi:hypothetical protein